MLCIAITGFPANPDQVTNLLGLVPTKVRRIEDGGRRSFNGWFFEAHGARLTGGADHERGFSVLRGALQGREKQFRRVWDDIRPESMSVYGGLYHAPEQQCGVWLEPDDMALLAKCHLGWGLDLFSSIERPPDVDTSDVG